MATALIGYTGFVGSSLLKQSKFDELYRSININEIKYRTFDLVICAGAPAQKWIANANPDDDKSNIDKLISCLAEIKCKKFVLISSVDVFKDANGVDELTTINTENLHAYGLNRYRLEKFVQQNFADHLIVRLPGLVGPGLRKNIIFDFLNNNNLERIESRGVFQFYPMVNLWSDIKKALEMNINLLHLCSEPISVRKIALECFNFEFELELSGNPAKYDMRSIYASKFGGEGDYQYSLNTILLAIRAYAQSEPLAHEI